MPKISLVFFLAGPVYLLIGMAGGIYMGASDDHSLTPVHAHLNLIGFVVMSVMGTFYALARDQVSMKLAWANFWILNLAVVVMIPSLAFLLKGKTVVLPILAVSEVLAVAAIAVFLVSVIGVWRKAA